MDELDELIKLLDAHGLSLTSYERKANGYSLSTKPKEVTEWEGGEETEILFDQAMFPETD